MRALTRLFVGHPMLLGATAVNIRTFADEPLPSAPAASERVLARGELRFVDAVHDGKGPVRLIELGGRRLVRFEDVTITNAPDVHVYLSRESGGKWSESTSLYLGALKATNGSFSYEVPAGMTVADYGSVVV